MSYTNGLDDPEIFFQAKKYVGTGGSQAYTFDGSSDLKSDFLWFKSTDLSQEHWLADSVRGVTKYLESDSSNAESTSASGLTSFDSDGFTFGSDIDRINGDGHNYVGWGWSAGGSAPAITYTVKVVSDSGNKYRFDDFGTSAVTLDLQEGGTYTFDQSDSSNSGHPLRFYTASDKSGGEYTTGVTTTGTAGSSGAKTVITVSASAPTLYYQCSNHAGMGGQANTNSTFGSSNFAGSIQSTVSASTTSGFSIISYTGTGSAGTIAHGLGAVPTWYFIKQRNTTGGWIVYHKGNTSSPETDYLRLDKNDTTVDDAIFNDTAPTSSVFSIGTNAPVNTNGGTYIAYCFADVKGYSKFGGYSGNSNTDGTFVYTGFSPAYVLVKRTDAAESWFQYDNKRNAHVGNERYYVLRPDKTSVENTSYGDNWQMDFLSNGFKLRTSAGHLNSGSLIFLAFAESPLVNSKGVPNNAR